MFMTEMFDDNTNVDEMSEIFYKMNLEIVNTSGIKGKLKIQPSRRGYFRLGR